MATALHLARLQRERGGDPLTVAVLEKARDNGAHCLSGAVFDPSVLRELVPNCESLDVPLGTPVQDDRVMYFTPRKAIRFPITPPPLNNHGCYVTSLNHLVKWMADLAEKEGTHVFNGFAASELLYDGDRVVGVRTGDRGIGREGEQKSNFEPGVDIRATVTILADGVRGNLTKTLVSRFDLSRDRIPQSYALGFKELWHVPPGRLTPGTVIHTLGHPLRFEEFGGGFLYALSAEEISVGFVVGLDYRDPLFDPHQAFQRFKMHPFVSSLLSAGQMIRYGAKALPEGGWHAIPKLCVDGAIIVGDAAGFVNSLRLKGIHLAMRTGMYAAEAAFEGVRAKDPSARQLSKFQELVDNGAVRHELYPVRNVHQSFAYGLPAGLIYAGLSLITKGWWMQDPMLATAGHERLSTVNGYYGQEIPEISSLKVDRSLTFDRLTNVHYSGTRHSEDQPSHLLVHDTDICRTRCRTEYRNPFLRFCPANVFEMVNADDGTGPRLQINASNCVHCKTCDIMDPYQIIDWVPPEGGGGPDYEGM